MYERLLLFAAFAALAPSPDAAFAPAAFAPAAVALGALAFVTLAFIGGGEPLERDAVEIMLREQHALARREGPDRLAEGAREERPVLGAGEIVLDVVADAHQPVELVVAPVALWSRRAALAQRQSQGADAQPGDEALRKRLAARSPEAPPRQARRPDPEPSSGLIARPGAKLRAHCQTLSQAQGSLTGF
jgi:hypothetical protein